MGFLEELRSAAGLLELQMRLLFGIMHLAVSLILELFILASAELVLVFLAFFVPKVALV